IAPSANSPKTNTRPPSITRNSATAIAGSAVSTRALSSEGSRRRPRRRRRAGRAAADRRLGTARGRLARRMPCGVPGSLAISGRSSPAESPPARGELGERLLERLAGEIWPQLVAEDQLRVGRLPQPVVGQAALAARADDQVRGVHLGRVQARP